MHIVLRYWAMVSWLFPSKGSSKLDWEGQSRRQEQEHTVLNRNCPILLYRPTPNRQIKYLNQYVANRTIKPQVLDCEILL